MSSKIETLGRNHPSIYPARLSKTVAELITQVAPISPSLTVAEVSDLFLKQPQLYYLPVVDYDIPVWNGLPPRFYEHLSVPLWAGTVQQEAQSPRLWRNPF